MLWEALTLWDPNRISSGEIRWTGYVEQLNRGVFLRSLQHSNNRAWIVSEKLTKTFQKSEQETQKRTVFTLWYSTQALWERTILIRTICVFVNSLLWRGIKRRTEGVMDLDGWMDGRTCYQFPQAVVIIHRVQLEFFSPDGSWVAESWQKREWTYFLKDKLQMYKSLLGTNHIKSIVS